MQEKWNDSVLRLMVTGTRRDGRRRYDLQSKRELARACLQSGVSLADGPQTRHERQPAAQMGGSLPARVQLPNGATLEFECTGRDAVLVSTVIETLGRCDVPSRR